MPESDLLGLWPHQSKGVTGIESAWNSGIRSVCFQLPTGGGKSRIIRQIVDNYASSKKVIYLIAHRRTLIQQLSSEISEADIRHGIIQSGYPYIKYRTQVCSIQTLARRIDKLPEPEIIILDECHHAKAETYRRVLETWSSARVLGVTATPRRPDGKPMSDIFQRLILGPTMRELIEEGYLSDYQYYAPDDVSMAGAHIRAGEYVASEATARVDKPVITGSAVEHYKKFSDHQPAIASCVSIAHAEHVAEQFTEAGYRAFAVHSKMDPKEISKQINGLRTGEVEILTQCELLGEGVDIKGAVTLIGLRPTMSEVIFLQHIGRVLRKAEGKPHAVILDHVGNWQRHGLPDDDREWSLAGVRPQQEQSKYKRCPQCLHPVPRTARECPECGYLWTATREPISELPEETEGKLINIRNPIDRNALVLDIARRADTLKEAIEIAREHGATHTQAWHIWTRELRNATA